MKPLRDYLGIRKLLDGPLVRPLALVGPILVLVIALPLLRPLRHPDPGAMSYDETLRLATVRALVEHHSLQLDRGYASTTGVVRVATGFYDAKPPMMSVLLWMPAWAMTRLGYSFDDNQLLIAYVLTMLAVTLPVAGAAGLIYRMGRLFELRRPWRAALGFAVVACSGLLSYSVVLNAHAPAATLVIASAACLIHVAAMNRDDRRAGWFALSGACGALAATLDPAASVMLVMFMFVIPAMRFSVPRRVVGVMLYILGAIPIISVHAAWNFPITGDMVPASVHAMFDRPGITSAAVAEVAPVSTVHDEFAQDDDDAAAPTRHTTLDAIGSTITWFFRALFADHGILSHFPVEIVGILGIAAVMHRHWPSSTKVLAAATGAGAICILILYRVARPDWSNAMFASRWFIVFTPMLLFWSGAWMRRRHASLAWGTVALLVLFSAAVGLIGATDPAPRHGFDRYTATSALSRLLSVQSSSDAGALAGKGP